jgi:integrase
LKKPGRATHVFRHTVTAVLRAAGVAEEDLQAVLGHRRATITAGYGGEYPLERKAKTISAIDYGFDVVDLLKNAGTTANG